MTGRPKLSVCIVTYNHERYIRDCILSVLLQDFPGDLEVLIGEDCSKDGTRAILQELDARFPGRLTLLFREENVGVFDNLRGLVARAKGDLIAHLDGDDYWMPGKLAAQLAFFARHPGCAAVYTNAHVIDDDGALKGGFNNAQPEIFDTNYLLEEGNFLNHSSVVYRAAFKDVVTGLPASFIDYRLHLRLSCRGALGYVNKDLVAYRLGSTTSMMAGQPDRVRTLYLEALTDPVLQGLPRSVLSRAAARGAAQFTIGDLIIGRVPRLWTRARSFSKYMQLNSISVFLRSSLILSKMMVGSIIARPVRWLPRSRLQTFYDR